jgi:hypothetical protein
MGKMLFLSEVVTIVNKILFMHTLPKSDKIFNRS